MKQHQSKHGMSYRESAMARIEEIEQMRYLPMPPKRDRRLKAPEDKVKAVSFSLSQKDLDALIRLGNGNASAGVRLLLSERKKK